MAFLLDTNVVSELRKSRPDPQVIAWYRRESDADVYLSTLTIGEIRHGIEKVRARDPKQAMALEGWLDGLLARYRDRILPVTADVAQEWGRLNQAAKPPVVDGLMAATAKVHRLVLVTRNVGDVKGAGVTVVNPFAA